LFEFLNRIKTNQTTNLQHRANYSSWN